MKKLYRRWMNDWETQLAFRSTNRVVRPFEWGLDWTGQWPVTRMHPRNGHDENAYLKLLNELAIEHSDHFFDYKKPTDWQLEGNRVRFTSPVHTRYPENNIVHGTFYPARNGRGARGSYNRKTAVIVLPHWNASHDQHQGLAAGIAKFGMAAVRISLPYHDLRMPPELERADYAVSSNIGRTIDATRQAVIDVRAMADWLQHQGYQRIALCGTSLGSCYAYLASAHDDRFEVNVYNHCSTYFGDVVWKGLSTQHIRQGLEGQVTVEQLRDLWAAISPPAYWEKYAAKKKKSLFMYAKYDTTFPLEFSSQVVEEARKKGLDHKSVQLPCGHYTEGESPFKFMAGYHIVSYLKRNL
jgi:dienelactone hydrolase